MANTVLTNPDRTASSREVSQAETNIQVWCNDIDRRLGYAALQPVGKIMILEEDGTEVLTTMEEFWRRFPTPDNKHETRGEK
jgi:hypothetical protein